MTLNVEQKKESVEMWKQYIEDNDNIVVESLECERWKLYKVDMSV